MEAEKEKECADYDAVKYELRAPEGGWGYVIVLATVTVFVCTMIPIPSFGIIFGTFLQNIGDETTGTALSNGMFNTAFSFTGLIANGLLNRYSFRKVGLAGSLIYILGASGLIFCQNLYQMITFFGVVQGIGWGLMLPASLSACNAYFKEKIAVMMGMTQASEVICSMLIPQVATWTMQTFGFRATLVCLAGTALLCLPAMTALQPVKWHMIKVPITGLNINDTVISVDHGDQNKKPLPSEGLKDQEVPLINQNKLLTVSQRSLQHKSRRSVISLGDRLAPVTTINELRDDDQKDSDSQEDDSSIWKSFIKSMDLSLLKSPKYINISLGLSLCYTSDMAFISIIPLMMGNYGFSSQQIASILSVFFGTDLAARILYTVISGIYKFRNRRLLVLFAALFSAIFRTVLVSNDSYVWQMSILAVLGFLRCFIQAPLTVVFSEEYGDQFSSAFSLYMAINGVTSLVFGLLMSVIKSYTQSDVMVCVALTMAFIICVISWIAELTICRIKSKNEGNK